MESDGKYPGGGKGFDITFHVDGYAIRYMQGLPKFCWHFVKDEALMLLLHCNV